MPNSWNSCAQDIFSFNSIISNWYRVIKVENTKIIWVLLWHCYPIYLARENWVLVANIVKNRSYSGFFLSQCCDFEILSSTLFPLKMDSMVLQHQQSFYMKYQENKNFSWRHFYPHFYSKVKTQVEGEKVTTCVYFFTCHHIFKV